MSFRIYLSVFDNPRTAFMPRNPIDEVVLTSPKFCELAHIQYYKV